MTDSTLFPDIGQYDLAKQQLARRRRLAEQLLQTRITPQATIGPGGGALFGSGAGGTVSAALDQLSGELQTGQLDAEEKNLATAEAQAANEVLSSIPSSGANRQQALLNAGNKFPSLRNSISALLASDERAREGELNRIDKGEQLAADRVAREESDEKYRRTFEQQMQLKQAPTVHVTTGGNPQRDRFSVQQGADGKMYRVNLETGEALPINIQGAGALTKPLAADKPLNEAQGNATLFGTRMAEADKVLSEVGTDYSPLKLDIARGAEAVPGGSAAVNSTLSPKEQKVAQAHRDFINAVLRKESGAAIAQSEFDNARRQYFPQPNDSTAVIEQKRKNRATAISGMKLIAGPGGKHIDAMPQQPTAPKPSVAPGTKGMHKGKPVVMGQDGEWKYE